MYQFDDWWTAKLWREKIERMKRRPLAEDFFYKYPPEPKLPEARSPHQERKAETQYLRSLIEQRTQLGDIDHGPLPRHHLGVAIASPRH
jgi:hypothetical protein